MLCTLAVAQSFLPCLVRKMARSRMIDRRRSMVLSAPGAGPGAAGAFAGVEHELAESGGRGAQWPGAGSHRGGLAA